jgi:hypothetical protein
MTKIHRSLGVLAAGLTLSLAGAAAAADSLFAVGPEGGAPYTNLYQVNPDGEIASTTSLVYPALGGGFFGLASPVTSIAFDHGNLFAAGPQSGSPYTNLYQVNPDGEIASTTSLVYPALGGGFSGLASPIASIAFDNGNLFAVGPEAGTPYTNLYQVNLDGEIASTTSLVYPALGGGFFGLASPVTAIAFDNGNLFAVGPEAGTPYTNLYQVNLDGEIASTTSLVYPALGGGFFGLASPITSIAFDNGNLFALGPEGGAPYTNLYQVDLDGEIASTTSLVYPALGGGFFGLTPPATSIAFDNAGGGVPEPAGWALMLLGFAVLGAALRARRAERGLVAGEGHAGA